MGTGRIAALATLAQSLDANMVIFDVELTPAQRKAVEEAVCKRIVDRAELILDIFEVQARSSEARMEVEPAQLAYLPPRLPRMWTFIKETRGGTGMPGPRETQLSTD